MFSNIFTTFRNSFKIEDLRKRILFTAWILIVCRFIAIIPIPGLDGSALAEFLAEQAKKQSSGNILGLFNMFTGGALAKCAVGSLGIMPYITATIIIQLLSAVIPQLSKLTREEGGRVKIMQYSRLLTVLLCLGQGAVMSLAWLKPGTLFSGFTGDLVIVENKFVYVLGTTLFLTTGTMLLMWLGEQITERGIGNGISLIITIGIISALPMTFQQLSYMFFPPEGVETNFKLLHAIVLVVLLIAVVAGVIAITQGQRKIPVQYAQRSVGRKVVPGGSSYMPLRVNMAGVMPIIFAQAILMFPQQLFTMLGAQLNNNFFRDLGAAFAQGSLVYMVTYALMILFFSYFWVSTQFNEIQISDDLKRNGGYIPGVRPGKATTTFLHNTMSRITLAGAVFLTVIAIIPFLLASYWKIPFAVSQFFGGTSILITVGVMLDTMRQLESHLMTRHYDGFMKKGKGSGRGPRLRGR
jgi:preprotein translocase subunit SecY